MPEEFKKTCCFTGHRANKLHRADRAVRHDLKKAIIQAIDEEYTTFITGMAYGVDIWAGEFVIEQRKKDNKLKLIAAVPFEGFESRWDNKWKKRYQKLIKDADEVHYICDGFAGYAFQRRNEWMVDRSSLVIAVYNGDAGGTQNTISYALKKDVPVIFLQG